MHSGDAQLELRRHEILEWNNYLGLPRRYFFNLKHLWSVQQELRQVAVFEFEEVTDPMACCLIDFLFDAIHREGRIGKDLCIFGVLALR